MSFLACDLLREIGKEMGWVSSPSSRSWFHFNKDCIIIDVYCCADKVWMSRENVEEFDYTKGGTGYNITSGPSISTNLSDPESIMKIQEYLRDICQKL